MRLDYRIPMQGFGATTVAPQIPGMAPVTRWYPKFIDEHPWESTGAIGAVFGGAIGAAVYKKNRAVAGVIGAALGILGGIAFVEYEKIKQRGPAQYAFPGGGTAPGCPAGQMSVKRPDGHAAGPDTMCVPSLPSELGCHSEKGELPALAYGGVEPGTAVDAWACQYFGDLNGPDPLGPSGFLNLVAHKPCPSGKHPAVTVLPNGMQAVVCDAMLPGQWIPTS